MTESVIIVNRGSIVLGPDDPFGSPLPGTEVVILNLAHALSQTGVEVTYYGRFHPSTTVDGVRFVDFSRWDDIANDVSSTILWVRDYTLPPALFERLNQCTHVLLTEDSTQDMRAIFRESLTNLRSKLKPYLPAFDTVVFASQWHLAEWRSIFGLDVTNGEVIYNLASHIPWQPRNPRPIRKTVHTSHPRKALAAVSNIAGELSSRGVSTTVSASPSLYQDDDCRIISPLSTGGWVDNGSFADFVKTVDAVTFVPPNPVRKMAEFLDHFEVLLHPDYTGETGATVAIEALRSGLIPVVSDIGALPEIVGDAGIVVPGFTCGPEYALGCADMISGLTQAECRRFAEARDGRQELFDDGPLIKKWSKILGLSAHGHKELDMLNSRRCIEVEDGSYVYVDPSKNLTWPDGAVIAAGSKLHTMYYDQRHAVTVAESKKLIADGIAYGVGARLFEKPELCNTVFDWDNSAELQFLYDHLGKLPEGSKGIEYGCGNGRLLMPLWKNGHCLDGIDVSEPTIQWLNKKVRDMPADDRRGRLMVADMASFMAPGQYDYAVAGLNTLRYLPSHAALRRHLHMAAASIVEKGQYLVLVDSWTESAGPAVDGDSGEWMTAPDPNGDELRVVWTHVRIDPLDKMALERVEVYRNDETVINEYQTQLALSLPEWITTFTESGEWSVASIHLDAHPAAVPVTDTKEPQSGNFWFVLDRTEVNTAPMYTR